jgi:hypothetical protein
MTDKLIIPACSQPPDSEARASPPAAAAAAAVGAESRLGSGAAAGPGRTAAATGGGSRLRPRLFLRVRLGGPLRSGWQAPSLIRRRRTRDRPSATARDSHRDRRPGPPSRGGGGGRNRNLIAASESVTVTVTIERRRPPRRFRVTDSEVQASQAVSVRASARRRAVAGPGRAATAEESRSGWSASGPHPGLDAPGRARPWVRTGPLAAVEQSRGRGLRVRQPEAVTAGPLSLSRAGNL